MANGYYSPMPIYTRTGDEGTTGLFGGGRVPKDHPRSPPTATWTSSTRPSGSPGPHRRSSSPTPLLEAIQRDLFALGGHLATPDPAKVAKALERATLSEARVKEFERAIDAADAELPPLRAFVLPGGTAKAAALHLARTVCRRAERSVVRLAREDRVPPLFTVYLNRLSDLLFALARLANLRAGVGDVTW